MPFASVTYEGLILGLSETPVSDVNNSYLYVDKTTFDSIKSSPHDYVYYSGSFHHHPRPDQYHAWDAESLTWKPDPDKLKFYRDRAWDYVRNKRDDRKYRGFPVTIDGVVRWFHSDEPSRTQLLGLALVSILSMIAPSTFPFPNNKYWKTMSVNEDGTPVKILLNSQIAIQILMTFVYIEGVNYEVAETHRLNIYSSNDPLNYDYSSGWTPVFGEV